MNTGQHFLSTCIHTLQESYLPRLLKCLDALTDEQIWQRPNDHTNSIGNLVLHITGNLRQWAVAGIGGEEDFRNRPREFDPHSVKPRSELVGLVTQTVRQAVEVLEDLHPSELVEKRKIQGYDVTVLQAAFHTTEHFGQHLGQIILLTKQMTDRDLGFYAHLNETGHAEGEPHGVA